MKRLEGLTISNELMSNYFALQEGTIVGSLQGYPVVYFSGMDSVVYGAAGKINLASGEVTEAIFIDSLFADKMKDDANDDFLSFILAHELGHIMNGDTNKELTAETFVATMEERNRCMNNNIVMPEEAAADRKAVEILSMNQEDIVRVFKEFHDALAELMEDVEPEDEEYEMVKSIIETSCSEINNRAKIA